MNGGNFVKKEKIYSLTVKGDNTLKTFDRNQSQMRERLRFPDRFP